MRLLLLLNGSRARYAGGPGEARLHVWRNYVSQGTQLEVGYLPDQAAIYPFGTGQALVHANLYPDRCAEAEAAGYDAVIIHCFADPGLDAARQRAKIPIIGPGEVTLHAAAILGRRIGLTVPSKGSLEAHKQQLRSLGLAERVVALEPIRDPIREYAQQDPRAMADAFVDAAQRTIERGAEVICPSGLAYIPVRVSAQAVSERLGVPVLDPAYLAVRTAEMLVGMKKPATITL